MSSEQDSSLFQQLREILTGLRHTDPERADDERSLLYRQLEDWIASAERRRHQSLSTYHSLVECLPLNVIRKNRDGQVTFVNQAYCELMGHPSEELLGKTDFDLFPPELAEKYWEDDLRVIESGEVFHDVEANELKGESKYFEAWKVPVHSSDGSVVESQAIFWDVTEQVRNREELRRSNRELDQFVAVVTHDLHAPLRAVAAYCSLLAKDESHSSDVGREYLQEMQQGVDR